ncbi:MAG TPA: DNA-directed RNA polymerase subunit omega [Firmicutes bacterium]|jgi:DNA-directed RNA polymerase subunit omega|nr:DNA-directed RNA polymerase subunit omega [Bacillota bacterium]
MRSQPYLDDLEKIVPSRYSLVVGVAKRAREILENGEESPNEEITKPVSLAMWEIMEGKVVLTKKPVDKQEK